MDMLSEKNDIIKQLILLLLGEQNNTSSIDKTRWLEVG